MGKIVITRLYDKDILFLFDDEHELKYIKCINSSIVGNIYIGHIDDINRALNCAFVSIAKKQRVFLPLTELPENVKCGSDIPVQIKADAIKTKLPQGTTLLCLAGEYCVCHLSGQQGLSISKKLPEYTANELITQLRSLESGRLTGFRWVIRTNSGSLLPDNLEPLYREMEDFKEKGAQIRQKANTRTPHTLIYEAGAGIAGIIKNIDLEDFDTVITDNELMYDELSDMDAMTGKTLRLYTESSVSLKNLYSLETHLLRLLEKKVYLHCGGYLVIEQTEAMNVIDVNSGKADGRKRDSNTFINRVNTEAAYEIARQIKLRNLSGMIMVDFISSKESGDGEKLLKLLNEIFAKDRVYTKAVDITKLGIVEITRKKVSLSLAEEFTD